MATDKQVTWASATEEGEINWNRRINFEFYIPILSNDEIVYNIMRARDSRIIQELKNEMALREDLGKTAGNYRRQEVADIDFYFTIGELAILKPSAGYNIRDIQ